MPDPSAFRDGRGDSRQDRAETRSGAARTGSREWDGHVRARLAPLRLSPTREADIVDELSQHLEQRYDELRGEGVSDGDARRLAIEELLDPNALAAEMQTLRQARTPRPVTPGTPSRFLLVDLWQDLRYAARMLRKQPGFAAAAILTLAIGIGANTAIFSLVNATLLQTLPVPDRDRLVYVHRSDVGGVLPYPLYEALRDGNHVLEGLAVWAGIAASLNANDTTALVDGAIVSGNFFDVLGVAATQGRLLSPSDDVTPGAHPVVVISHHLWQSRFAGQTDIVGREVRLNGHVFTIVGVTPPDFPGPQVGTARDLYVPMMMQPIMRPPSAGYSGEQHPDLLRDPRGWLSGVGRLEPTLTLEQARAELAGLATAYAQTIDASAGPERIVLVPIDEGDRRQRQRLRAAALLLGGVVATVLLIACANIMNLLLARAAARRREVAVRLAVGASRARLVRQLLTESVLLSTIGGAVGVGLAWMMVQVFQIAPPPLPFRIEFAIDQRVLLFSLGLSLFTGIVFGLAPALQASRPDLVPALKDASTDGHQRGRRFNLQKALVVAEVALSMLLLIPAALFVRSLQAARAIDPGVDVERVLSAPLNIGLLRYTSADGRRFYRQAIEGVESLAGVEAASVARVPVMAGSGRVVGLTVEGRDGRSAERVVGEGRGAFATGAAQINVNVVSPAFFQTLGIPFVAGRGFSEQDIEGRPPVVIVNETAARLHFGVDGPLGQRVSLRGQEGPWQEIVGIVRDSKYAALGEPALPVIYLPLGQNHETGMTLYVRTSVPPETLIRSVRHEIQAIDPNLPVPNIQTMTQTIGTSLYAARMGAWLLAAFGALALLLAAIGIYGVLSFSVSRRTREMGVRFALGADSRGVFLQVVRDGMLLVCGGIAIGLGGGLAAARSLASFLYGVSTWDPSTFVAMTVVLLAVAFAACAVPARRAMRLNPITALRHE